MEANKKLANIEKKMDMSLDDLIKMNRSGSGAGGGKKQAKGKAGGRAPVVLSKTKKGAPKTLAAGSGPRKAIQQKKAAKAAATGKAGGVQVKKAGLSIARPLGVAKKTAGGGGLKHTMAQKILNRARGKVAPKMLGQQKLKSAPKSLAQRQKLQAPKMAGQPKKQQAKPGSLHPSMLLNKSLDQTIQERRQQQVATRNQKQQRAPAQQQPKKKAQQAPRTLAVNGKKKQQQQQLGVRGGISKQSTQKQQQKRAPVMFQQSQPQGRRGAPGGRAMQQQVQAPRRRMAPPPAQMAPRRLPAPQYDDRRAYREPVYYEPEPVRMIPAQRPPTYRIHVPHAPYEEYAAAPAAPAQGFGQPRSKREEDAYAIMEEAEKRAAMAALRLQRLEDAVRKAERKEHMFQQQSMNSNRLAARGAPAAAAVEELPPAAVAAPLQVVHGGMGGASVQQPRQLPAAQARMQPAGQLRSSMRSQYVGGYDGYDY